jgi:hypothetical protein
MRNRLVRTASRKDQGGYALLIVVFLTTLILIATMSIGLRILTEGRREREQEMIWRGKQYVRGIKLYYAQYGRFPTSLDQMTQLSTGNIRFMRQAYKDPMNKADGSWRLIYVGPSGQLIGSLKPPQNPLQIPGAAGQPAAPQGTSPGAFGSQTNSFGFGTSPGTTPGAPAPGTGITGTGIGAQGTDTTGTGTDSQGVPTGDTPTIVGGNIIGVGSKVNHASVIVYEQAKNYRLFEFVWDPSKDMGIVSSTGTPPGTASGTQGQNPTGSQPNFLNPQSGPPLTNPNPNPNPNPQQQ